PWLSARPGDAPDRALRSAAGGSTPRRISRCLGRRRATGAGPLRGPVVGGWSRDPDPARRQGPTRRAGRRLRRSRAAPGPPRRRRPVVAPAGRPDLAEGVSAPAPRPCPRSLRVRARPGRPLGGPDRPAVHRVRDGGGLAGGRRQPREPDPRPFGGRPAPG